MSEEEKPTKKTFDLAAALRPLAVDIEGLGEVRLSLRSTSFLEWLKEGEKRGRWTGTHEFVRNLIRERSEEGGEHPAVDAKKLAGLNGGELDAAADAIVEKAGAIFTSFASRGRKRSDPPPDDPLPPLDGETGSERLYRLAKHYRDDYDAYNRRLFEDMKRTIDPLGELRNSLGAFDRLPKLIGATEEFRKLVTPSFVERQRSIAEQLGATGVYRDMERNRLAIASAGDLLNRQTLVDEHRAIAAQLADAFSPLRTVREAMQGLSIAGDLARKLDLGSIAADRAAWAKLVSSQFALGITPDVISAMSGIQESASAIAASTVAAQAAALLRPGYRSAATLALEGIIGRGVTADLLHDYDNADRDRAPFFASVIESVSVLDDPDATEAEQISALQRLIVAFEAIRGFLKAEYQKAGIVAVLALAVAVYSALPDNCPTPIQQPLEIRQAAEQIKAMSADLRLERERADERRNRIRYVRGPVNLRAEPHRGGLVIRLVYPDQWVQVLETKGEWARVEVFDYRSDAGIEGWINRRNLRATPD